MYGNIRKKERRGERKGEKRNKTNVEKAVHER